jgi:hypothetical protein
MQATMLPKFDMLTDWWCNAALLLALSTQHGKLRAAFMFRTQAHGLLERAILQFTSVTQPSPLKLRPYDPYVLK